MNRVRQATDNGQLTTPWTDSPTCHPLSAATSAALPGAGAASSCCARREWRWRRWRCGCCSPASPIDFSIFPPWCGSLHWRARRCSHWPSESAGCARFAGRWIGWRWPASLRSTIRASSRRSSRSPRACSVRPSIAGRTKFSPTSCATSSAAPPKEIKARFLPSARQPGRGSCCSSPPALQSSVCRRSHNSAGRGCWRAWSCRGRTCHRSPPPSWTSSRKTSRSCSPIRCG